MKKLVILLAVISVFFTACRTDTTIDTASTAPTPTSTDDDAVEPTASVDDETEDDAADQDEPTPEPTPEPTAEPTATRAPTPEPTTDDSSAAEASPEQAAAIQAIADADDWCEAAAVVESRVDVLDTVDFADPDALEQSLTQAIVAINAAQRLAPPEIDADVAQTVEGFTDLATALEAAEWSFIDLDLAVLDEIDAGTRLSTYNIERYNFEVCGIGTDPGEPPTDEDLAPSLGDDPELEGTIRDQAVLGLTEAGFTAAEATCILESLDISDPAAFQDTTALFNVFTECGISLDRLGQIGGG